MIQDATPADKARVQRHPYRVRILRTQCSRFRAPNELVQHPARSVGNPRAKAKLRVHIRIEACRCVCIYISHPFLILIVGCKFIREFYFVCTIVLIL